MVTDLELLKKFTLQEEGLGSDDDDEDDGIDEGSDDDDEDEEEILEEDVPEGLYGDLDEEDSYE